MLEQTLGRSFETPHALYHWTIEEPELFWDSVWSFCGIVASKKHDRVLGNAGQMPGAQWFEGAALNFAENLLRYRDTHPAIIFCGEDQVRRMLTHEELFAQVAWVQRFLLSAGIRAGDRVAGFMPNIPETVIAMLAAASIGAIWTSCSPDFGPAAVVDRFGQTAPRVLFCADGYFFKGNRLDCLEKTAQIVRQIPSIEKVVIVPYAGGREGLLPQATHFPDLIGSGAAPALQFAQLPFAHPLYIVYSSGTTGVPKCLVHGAGGTLLEHMKEHSLHVDLQRDDRLFYQTTCGWMMWNWLVSGLTSGATILLYDGSPLLEGGRILFDIADREEITIFGTNAKFISTLSKEGLCPRTTHRLSKLKTILSTGSPLAPESFDYVYSDNKEDVQLASISGGTDIIGCFALGCPALPVRRGELQIRSFGLKVEVFDETGRSVSLQKGDLVCTAPFPSMPVCFWNDPEGSRYLGAYFRRFPGVWHHGDYVALTESEGMIFFGRSDAVLNPGGIRIGSAEIYRIVEQLPELVESLVVGQDWQGDVRVVLFVRLREGLALDDALRDRIRREIRANASPFHVPAKILQVSDIPRTCSGKIVELAVRDLINGKAVHNAEALANPAALDLYRDIPELRE